jgi:hypothetical protein
VSPDGALVLYSRRVSGFEKIYSFPLANPQRKTQLTFGTHNDVTPTFSANGERVYFSSDEDDDIFNLRSLDLKTGVIRQYTDALGGDMMPAALPVKGPERAAFVAYFRASTGSTASSRSSDEGDRPGRLLGDRDRRLPARRPPGRLENKRRNAASKASEGWPPLNIAVTSNGDFFGGSQIALTDVLGDQNITAHGHSFREFRSYQGVYTNLATRLHYGVSAFDQIDLFLSDRVRSSAVLLTGRRRFTQRQTGAIMFAQYPIDKYRRLEFSGGSNINQRMTIRPSRPIREQAALSGQQILLVNGLPPPVAWSRATRWEFGPPEAPSLGASMAPPVSG